MEKVNEFLDNIENTLKEISKKANLAYFDAAITGKKELYDEYEKYSLELEKFYNNRDDFEKLKKFMLEKNIDPIIKRQLEVHYNNYLGSQGDINLIKEIIKKATAIEQKFNTYRASVDGKELTDNEIKEILEHETDSEKLKKAWEANKKQGELVEKELIELIKLRNKLAKSLGYKNYHMMSLELSEQNLSDIEKIFDELNILTEKPFQELKSEIDNYLSKRYSVKITELKPWHYQDLFFQEGPKITEVNLDSFYNKDIIETSKKYYMSIGLGKEVEDILKKSDLYEKPKKYQHACCIDIDREGDVRIIMNAKNNEKWMETSLHELGHAIFDKNIDQSLPFSLKYASHIFVTEAIAQLFGRKSRNQEFIKNYSDANSLDINKASLEIKNTLRLRQLVFARWSQVMFRFEKELYNDPGQDLNKLWWNIVNKYQLINFSRDKPDWASKIHLVSSPAYYHNYLLGELLASQLNNYILNNIITDKSTTDYSGHPESGVYLKKQIFFPGKKYKWNDLIEKATGEKLTPKYYVEEFCK